MKPYTFSAGNVLVNRICCVWLIVALTSVTAFAQASGQSGKDEDRVETFYQQVEIQRQPRFSLQGMLINQQIRYRIQSTFELHPPDLKGHRIAIQTISDTVLIEADPLSKAAFEQSLLAMQGHSFTYELDKFANVVSMTNQQDNSTTIDVEQPQSRGMLVSTVIDEDGWKELAQLTLFQPPTGRSARSFSRKTTHDWGALGSWYGKTDFVSRDEGRNRKRFSYKHGLEYLPPEPEANQPNALPFTVTQANFKTYEAFGEILYDSKEQRVTSVREVFHAKGSIAANVLGVATNVDLEERQVFAIEVTRQRVLRMTEPSKQGERR